MSTAPRRPRRAVRRSGTVGTDESVLQTRLPALPQPAAPAGAHGVGTPVPTGPTDAGSGPAAGAGADDLWRTTRSADDSDRGWGREESSSNDERLLRDKPPHW